MGHIELAVVPTRFLKSMPSRLGLLLDTARNLERVIYYENYLVVDPGKTPLKNANSLPNKNIQLKTNTVKIPLLPVWVQKRFAMP